MVILSITNMSSTEESEERWMAEMDNICSNLNMDPAAAEKSKESFLEIKRNFTLDVSSVPL